MTTKEYIASVKATIPDTDWERVPRRFLAFYRLLLRGDEEQASSRQAIDTMDQAAAARGFEQRERTKHNPLYEFWCSPTVTKEDAMALCDEALALLP